MSNAALDFPLPVRRHGRLYWLRSELERYKKAIICAARGELASHECGGGAPPKIEEFVPSDRVAAEFGFTRRTLGRRIAGREICDAA
jgi:hypothetical protein